MATYKGTDADDTFTGTDGDDVMSGGVGYDELYGLGGSDTISGGGDSDYILGGDSRDRITGDDGDDTVYGEAGNDIVYGGAGDDFVLGGAEADLISGDAGDDVMRGDEGNDTLSGGDGNDSLRGSAGIDRLDGGAGIDTASFFDIGAKQGAIVDLRTGAVSNDGFGNFETLVSVESLGGTLNADTLLGSDTANVFGGGAGDTIRGFGGTDIFYVDSVRETLLDGGSGVNSLTLSGTTTIVGADGRLHVVYSEQGMIIDLARQQVLNDGFGYSATIVGFRNAGSSFGDDTIRGSSAANELRGGSGDDHLSGGNGNDLLVGDYGADTLTGGAGADVFAFGIDGEYFGTEGDLADTITDFMAGDKLQIVPTLIPLTFVGTRQFTDSDILAIRYEVKDGATFVYARDHEPGGHVDLTIKLAGVHRLTADDFMDLRHASVEPHAFVPDALALHPAAHLADSTLAALV